MFRFLVLLFLTCYLPAFLIWRRIFPFEYRFYVFIVVLAGFFVYCGRRRYSLHELGFRMDNLGVSLRWNLVFCAIGAVLLYSASKTGMAKVGNASLLPYFYAVYIVFLGPVQEVVFRGVLFAEMQRRGILDQKWILVISTVTFCFLHVIYRQQALLVMTFIGGLIWGLIFARCRNIWGVSFSHSVLGALAMFLGVI